LPADCPVASAFSRSFWRPRAKSPGPGPLCAHRMITWGSMVRSPSWNFFPTGPLPPLISDKWEGAVSNSSAPAAQYLPCLRRYARAVTGSEASGDAYVAATLEALIADRAVIEDPRGPRVALYRLFTKIWNSVAVNGAPATGEDELPGEHKLANITPLPRQAFLLVA